MDFDHNDLNDKANTWDVEYLQEQIWELQAEVRDLKEKIERDRKTALAKLTKDERKALGL